MVHVQQESQKCIVYGTHVRELEDDLIKIGFTKVGNMFTIDSRVMSVDKVKAAVTKIKNSKPDKDGFYRRPLTGVIKGGITYQYFHGRQVIKPTLENRVFFTPDADEPLQYIVVGYRLSEEYSDAQSEDSDEVIVDMIEICRIRTVHNKGRTNGTENPKSDTENSKSDTEKTMYEIWPTKMVYKLRLTDDGWTPLNNYPISIAKWE